MGKGERQSPWLGVSGNWSIVWHHERCLEALSVDVDPWEGGAGCGTWWAPVGRTSWLGNQTRDAELNSTRVSIQIQSRR